MYTKIVLAGGTGYLGNVLARYYKNKATEIVVLTRQQLANTGNIRYCVWDGKTTGVWTQELEDATLIVNLSGKSVNCRYTPKNREEIVRSRVGATKLLGEVIGSLTVPPKLWINCASATIYRYAEDHAQDEETGELGSGFSVDVCKAWEHSFYNHSLLKTRPVLLRVSLVLGRSDGVYPRLRNLALARLGGQQGSGQQYVSWIHEQDFARITEWMIQNEAAAGTYNAAAPQALQNRDFMATIRKHCNIRIGVPMPRWLLELGAKLIGTETELILKSRWVYPGRLLKEGFHFDFADAESAIQQLQASGKLTT